MSFTTATINSGTPVKDLMAALNTQLTTAGYQFVETYGTPGSAVWTQAIYGGGQFVAVASGTATAATSPDGITWTPRTLPGQLAWNSVAYGGGLYVALAASTPMYATSTDGITWTQRTLPALGTPYIAYGAGLFVVIFSGNTVMLTSPDGINWTLRYLPAALTFSAITYGGGQFVTCAASSGVSYTSPDGINWTSRALPSGAAWSSITYGGGVYVVVSTTAAAASSPDGITWTARTLPAGNYAQVTYGGGLFVTASTSSGTAASSPDGATWTARTLPAILTYQSVAYGAGVFTTLANSSPAGAAATSPDGITWTARTACITSTMAVADVYRSPAASNAFGQDWYLILRRVGDTGATLFYQVAEQYNSATHRVSVYGGTGSNTAPVAGTYANPGAPLTPETACAGGAVIAAVSGSPFTYWASVTADRIVVGIKTATEAGFYAGLYDDLLPAGITGFPLVCTIIPNNQTATSAIGGSSSQQTGGFTREPLQNLPSNQNFEARIHNGYLTGTSSITPVHFTPTPTPAALYGNAGAPSRVLLGGARQGSTGYLADSVRGLLIGCVQSAVLSVAGDTITSAGKTYVRLAGPATTFGVFADQGL